MERYKAGCNFTNEELEIIEMRANGVSLVGMAARMSMSPSSVSGRLHSIKKKMEEFDNFT